MSFPTFLAQVRKVCLGAFEHPEFPLEKLSLPRDPNHNLFIQILFQLRNFPKQSVTFQGLDSESVKFRRQISDFELSLNVFEEPDRLLCQFDISILLRNHKVC